MFIPPGLPVSSVFLIFYTSQATSKGKFNLNWFSGNLFVMVNWSGEMIYMENQIGNWISFEVCLMCDIYVYSHSTIWKGEIFRSSPYLHIKTFSVDSLPFLSILRFYWMFFLWVHGWSRSQLTVMDIRVVPSETWLDWTWRKQLGLHLYFVRYVGHLNICALIFWTILS